MIKNPKSVQMEELYSVQLPEKTDSYQPVSHKQLYETVCEKLDRAGLKIKKEVFRTNRLGTQMTGTILIDTYGQGTSTVRIDHEAPEIGIAIGLRNSYDKTLTAGITSGGGVWVCYNGVFTGEIISLRKHTPKITKELDSIVQTAVDRTGEEYKKILEDVERMKVVEMSRKQVTGLLGDLFFNESRITSEQMNIIKKNIDNPDNPFYVPEGENHTLWTTYNEITESLKVSHPMRALQDHIELHKYAMQYV